MVRQLRVLVVDDNPVDAHLVGRTLARASIDADTLRVTSAAQLRAALSEGADLLVTELEATDIDADDVLALAAEHAPQERETIPVVLVSSAQAIGEPGRWLDRGFDDVVAKERLHRLPQAARRALGSPEVHAAAPSYRPAAPASSDLHFTLDHEHRLLFADARWQEMLGYDPDAIFGAALASLVTLDSRIALDSALDALDGERLEIPLALLALDGERVEFDAVLVLRHDEAGFRGIDGALRPRSRAGDVRSLLKRCRLLEEEAADLDARNRDLSVLNQALGKRNRALHDAWRDLDERLEIAGFATDDGLWDWRIDDDQVFFSSRWGALVGAEDRSIVAGPDVWFSRVLPQDLDALDSAIGAHLQGDAAGVDVEFRVRGDDGAVRRVRCRAVAKRDPRGRATRLGGALSAVRRGAHAELLAAPAMDRLSLAEDLRHALDAGELSLHYQPIADPESGELRAIEALARWTHPTRGAVPPSVFVPAAETLELIVPIGTWALREASRQFAAWRAAGLVSERARVAVNVSAKQFMRADFVALVRAVLEQCKLPARALELEVTESTLLDDVASATRTVRELRALGVSVAIDDFGTGFSSLAYLHEFDVDTLKIDRTFVARMLVNEKDDAIVASLVRLGAALGLHVVAEGVELIAHFDRLRAIGCPSIQGFLIGAPACADDFERTLRDSRGFHPDAAARPCSPERLP